MVYKMYFTNVLTRCGCKKAHSDHYLCCSHATTSFLLMTKILSIGGPRVPLDDKTELNHNKRFSLR